MRRLVCVTLVLVAGLAGRARADEWDTVDDSAANTVNELSHGATQRHNCGGGVANQDFDWFVVNSLLGHSYEFRVDGQTSDFYAFAYRFAANGTTALPLVDNEGGGGAYGAKSFTWTQASANSGKQFIEVTGYRSTGVNTPDAYTARFYETTISFPRYNNTSGQATVLLLQNTTARAVAGEYTLHTAAGALVVSTSFSIAPLSALVVNTAGTSANNTSGTIVVDHDGGYGGLTGKAVALDPATGFSFDTLGAYLPN